MIGTELLNLMYGDPLRQAMAPPQPAPNPNPQAPPAAAPRPAEIQRARVNQGPAPGAWTPAPPGPGTLRGPLPGPPAPPGVNVQGGAGANPYPLEYDLPHKPTTYTAGPSGAPGPASAAPGGQPPSPPAQPQPLPQSGPPSTAPQSPTDVGQLYMQLYNRQRSANEIDRGLSMLAAINSPPSMANAIMSGAGRGDAQDPAQAMNMLLQMRYMQQLANMPAPAGMDAATWNALPPDARMKVVQSQAESGIKLSQQGAEQKQKDFIDAQHAAPAAITQLSSVDSLANQVIGASDANGNPVMKGIVENGIKRSAAEALLHTTTVDPAKGGGFGGSLWNNYIATAPLSQAEKDVINNLGQLSGQVYGEEFKNAGSRRTQAEIKGLVSGASQLTNLNQSFDNYKKQFGAFQDKLHTTYANTLGEAGRVDEIPENMRWDMNDPSNPKPRVDSAFLQGGDQYHGGGQWASNPPPKQGGPTAPDVAIAYLKAHPDLASQFDAKYGQGASARVLHAQ